MAPSPAWASVRAQAKRGQGYVQAGLLSREINENGVPTLLSKAEGHIADGVTREPSADPARSENQGMYGIFTRENREIPRSPFRVMAGRAAQETLRRYA
ncbi:MAG TPA: hypothetical protein VGO77_04775 [Mycobacterium sp.]|nr:hypothetical protein [Mycobacterium sp.]